MCWHNIKQQLALQFAAATCRLCSLCKDIPCCLRPEQFAWRRPSPPTYLHGNLLNQWPVLLLYALKDLQLSTFNINLEEMYTPAAAMGAHNKTVA